MIRYWWCTYIRREHRGKMVQDSRGFYAFDCTMCGRRMKW